ncbi:hypothetical protein [Moorena producens]|uniref:hypothetical protein n=1 Tax=Moorena producens TaxID=1155739 RepID=UPI003C7787F3
MSQLNQILILYLTMPASDFYLSKMLAKSTNPSLEPFKADKVDVASLSFFGQTIDIKLQDFSIAGLTNIQIEKENGQPKIEISGDTVTFVATLPNTEAPPAGVPTKLTAQGNLLMIAGGEASPLVPITITVTSGQLQGTFTATGDPSQSNTVSITFTNLDITTEATSSNIVVDLSQLDSIFKPQVEELLQKPSTLEDLVKELNKQVNQQSVLAAVSSAGTQAAQDALKSFTG